MKTAKKILSVILSILMILSTVSCLGMVAFAENENTNERTVELGSSDISNSGYDGEYTTIHDFTGALKDNEDGTHSYKCTGCGAYGEAVSHTFVDFVCECGAEDTAGKLVAKAKVDAIDEINAAKENSVSNKAKDIDTDALENAGTVEEVEQLKNEILAQIAAFEKDFIEKFNNALEITVGDAIKVKNETGGETYLKFIPEVSGVYSFVSYSDYDTIARLYNSDFYEIDYDDDSGTDNNFRLEAELTAGETYYYMARFYYNDEDYGSFYVQLFADDVDCEHKNTVADPGVAADCTHIGYTSGVFCNDCGLWISGHEFSGFHKDINGDYICDICNTIIDEVMYLRKLKEDAYHEIVEVCINTKSRRAMITSTNALMSAATAEEIIQAKNDILAQMDAFEKELEQRIKNAAQIHVDETVAVEGEYELTVFKFIPEHNGIYSMKPISDGSTYGRLTDSEFNRISHHAIFGGDGVYFSAELKKGETYYIGVATYNESEQFPLDVVLSADKYLCDHENDTVELPGTPASCTEFGYTDGVFCNECGKWISGHKIIIGHSDENNDGLCDICGLIIGNEEAVIKRFRNKAIAEITAAVETSKLKKIHMMSLDSVLTAINSSDDHEKINEEKNKILDTIALYEEEFTRALTDIKEMNSYVTNTIEISDNRFAVVKFNPPYDGRYSLYSDISSMIIHLDNEMNADSDIFGNHDNRTVELKKGETAYFCICFNDSEYTGPAEMIIELEQFSCGHRNTINDAGTLPTCTEEGVTAGVYCNDCEKWISGHEVIAPKHTDKNNDHICDICNEESVIAKGICESNLTWKLYEDGLLEISGNGGMDYDEMPPWMSYFDKVKTVVIDEGVTSICYSAFSGFIFLTEAKLPDSLNSIGSYAFYDCINLKEITIPDGVTSLDNYAFFDCYSLEKINIGSGIKEIGSATFGACLSLKSIIIPETVESIDSLVFDDCYGLRNVTILNPDCVIDEDNYGTFETERILIMPVEDYLAEYKDIVIKYRLLQSGALDNDDLTVEEMLKLTIMFQGSNDNIYADTEGGMLPYMTLSGYKNSTAEEYADYWNIKFHALDELPKVKADALAEIEAAKNNAKNAEVANISVDPVNNATTVEEVESAKNEILTAIANAEKALADAKTSATAEINTAKTEANKEIAEKAIADIDAVSTVDAVNPIKTKALTDMAKADEDEAKALAEAKPTAIAEINNAKTEANAAIAEKAIADIDAASTVDAVNSIKTKALNDMAKADEDAAAAKALAEAKTAVISEIKATLTGDSTDAEKALVDEAVKEVENAKSVAEVENAKSDFAEKWKELHTQEDPTDPDDPSHNCNHMCHKGGFMGFIWKIVRFFTKLFGTNKVCKCGAAHY